jgi:hypothetical protein
LTFADEDSIPKESHPVSYFSRSPDIADNDEELSDIHSFDKNEHQESRKSFAFLQKRYSRRSLH